MEARTLGGIEHVYREQAGRLWRSLLVFTGDPDVASDAVAEAFAQVIARGQRVLDPASWVWRVAYRIAAGELQRRAATRSDGVVPDRPAEMAEHDVDLMAAVAQLPQRQRAAIVLHYLSDLSTPEIARTLRVTPATVRVLLLQGRRRLRGLLGWTDERPA